MYLSSLGLTTIHTKIAMALVVLLRGVNVGGHKTFRPTLLTEQLKHLDVVNLRSTGHYAQLEYDHCDRQGLGTGVVLVFDKHLHEIGRHFSKRWFSMKYGLHV